MRAIILAVTLLGGCREERTFDERYADTQRNIEQRAAELDAQLNEAKSAENRQ